MIIAKIETFPLRIPFKPGNHAAASPWGDKDLPTADFLLVKVTKTVFKPICRIAATAFFASGRRTSAMRMLPRS